MSVLNDKKIKEYVDGGRIVITPAPEDVQFQPASVDLRLSDEYVKFNSTLIPYIDTHEEVPSGAHEFQRFSNVSPLILQPSEFVLCRTFECVRVPDDLLARVEGRSSIGRLGVAVHVTAGFIDPGFEGTITLEIVNLGNVPVVLYPHQRVCQIVFEELTGSADRPYGSTGQSKYQYQHLPTPSGIFKDL